MSNGSGRKVSETAAVTSFCIEDQGETERARNRNCWQRIRSAFCHCFENLTDCLNFWFCKNECCNFCCTCDDYYDDDENERYGVAPALIRSQQNLEALTEKGIANEAAGTENEEFSSLEIHAVSQDCVGGDGDFKCGDNSEKHSQGLVESQSGDQQSSGGQQSDYGVCVIGGGGNAENHSGVQQPIVSHHTNHGASDSANISGCDHTRGSEHTNHVASYSGSESGGHHPSVGYDTNNGANDSGNNSGGHHTSGSEHTNHGASCSGSDPGGHHTSGGDYAVSDFGGGGDSGGGGWGGD